MRTRKCDPKHLENLFLRDPDFSCALIQALENHCTYMRHLRTCHSPGSPSFLRYISSFIVQKTGWRASRRFHKAALLISRNLHTKNHRILNGLRTLPTSTYYSPYADSGLATSRPDGTPLQTRLEPHITPATNISTARRERVRFPLSRRSTFSGSSITSISRPSFESPIHSHTLSARLDPPLTPVNQILSTPLNPPRIENKEPRTPYSNGLLDKGFDFNRLSLANTRSPEETPYPVHQPNHRLSFRNRLWVRRLSYPHFKISTVSHPSCSPLKMPDVKNAFSANHQLASPLHVRSPTPRQYTPQVTEDGAPYLQWSPQCLRCFA